MPMVLRSSAAGWMRGVCAAVGMGALLLGALPAAAQTGPSVAVLNLAPEKGVDESTARVLSESTVDAVRRTKVFSRVVSSKELETILGVEMQKQLMNCSASSCMAELAGALGVDFLLSGTVAKLGTTYVFNARLLNARTGVAAASISQRMRGGTEEGLLEAVEPLVQRLLSEAGFTPATIASAAPAATSTTTPPSATPAAAADAQEGSSKRPILLAGGAGALVAAAVGAVAALGMGAVAGLVLEDLLGPAAIMPVPVPFLGRAGALGGSVGVAGVAALAALVLAGVGVALLVTGMVSGG